MPQHQVYFDDQLYAMLQRRCKSEGCTFSSLVSSLVKAALEAVKTQTPKSEERLVRLT